LRAVKFKQVALIYAPLLLMLFAVNFVFLRENGSDYGATIRLRFGRKSLPDVVPLLRM
jgi:hypothetical protein